MSAYFELFLAALMLGVVISSIGLVGWAQTVIGSGVPENYLRHADFELLRTA